jgi:thioesterase domain-containing protein
VPRTYPGRVTLFRAGAPAPEPDPDSDADLGWSRVSALPAEVFVVPATHLGMLVEPGVQRLAEQLRTRLEGAQPWPSELVSA